MKSTSSKAGRPSKYSLMAESLLQDAGFDVNAKSRKRVEHIEK